MSSGMPGTVRGRFGGVVGIAHTGRMRWLVRQEEGGGRRQAGTAGHRWLCGLTGRAFWGHPFIPIPNKGNAKECSNYCTIALISHASKVMLKILQGRLQQYMNRELPDVQAGFRKSRGTRDQIANICWIIEKAREFQKNIYFCFFDYAKAFDSVDHNKLENSEGDGNTRPPDMSPEKSV